MEANSQSIGFFDAFFWACAAIAALLGFIDWLIGSIGREKIQKKVGDWWVFLEENSYAGLVRSDAYLLHKWFLRHLRYRRLITISLFVTTCLIFPSFFTKFLPAGEWLAYSSTLIFSNIGADCLSLFITIFFLRRMARSVHITSLLAFVVLDIVFALGMVWYIVNLSIDVSSVVAGKTYWDQYPKVYEMIKAALNNFPHIENSEDDYGGLVLIVAPTTAIIPTLFHVVLATLFIISKAVRPFIQKPIKLILARIYESKRGVLLLTGIFIATIAKLIQELLKGN